MIIDKDVVPDETLFGHLSCGDPFFLRGDEDEDLFIVIDQIDINLDEGVNAVRLEDGSAFFFDSETAISPARAKVVRY